MKKTMVVVPTYNEVDNITRLVDSILSQEIPDSTILIVDDNSPDGTGQVADELAERFPGRVSVLHRTQKDGLGRAYLAGFREALAEGADYIIQMDADFSHDPTVLAQLVRAAGSADLVIGSRYVRNASVDESWSMFRKLLSWFANVVYIPTILRLPVRDATGGFRLWHGETLRGMGLDRIRSSGYIFQTEMAYVAHRLGYRITEIPIHFADRSEGQSKMSFQIQLEAALRVWQVRLHHNTLKPHNRVMRGYA